MQANYVQRIRLTFSKTGTARFISHLDLAKAVERTLVRANLPVAYSQGYNRRPRLQFAGALPLGFASEAELVDIWLAEKMLPDQILSQLAAKSAPGIAFRTAQEIPLADAALQTVTASATYVAKLFDALPAGQLQHRIDALLSSKSFAFERTRGKRTKKFDLRAAINDLRLERRQDGRVEVHLDLSLLPDRSARPDDVLFALGLDPLDAQICRTQILLGPGRHEVLASQA